MGQCFVQYCRKFIKHNTLINFMYTTEQYNRFGIVHITSIENTVHIVPGIDIMIEHLGLYITLSLPVVIMNGCSQQDDGTVGHCFWPGQGQYLNVFFSPSH
jgi:hypothetical protein